MFYTTDEANKVIGETTRSTSIKYYLIFKIDFVSSFNVNLIIAIPVAQ